MKVQSSTGFLKNAELAARGRRRGNGEEKNELPIRDAVVTCSWATQECHEPRVVETLDIKGALKE